ncbi:hypothetical protein SUDANB121_05325 [Nocardiopsis dassonvillei]|uniref:hypothetical protein n=1 Tax=Nocardiopsis dassonvillei TaxID=2014 RepID=UPI003F548940
MRQGIRRSEQTAAGARAGVRSLARGVVREVKWAVGLAARSLPIDLDRAEAEPWDDRRLFTGLAVFAVGAVALSLLLGFGVADWMRTEPSALLIAGAGAVAVGALLLSLAYLVFASRRRRRPVRERE